MKKPHTRRPWAVALGAIVVGTVAYACATPLVPEDVKLRPNAMAALTPTTRSATVGTTLQNEPAVIIRDQYGDPLPGVTVNFVASSGTAPTPSSSMTADNGHSSPTSWALPTASGTVTMTASVPGTTLSALTFTVTLNPGPASTAAVNTTTPSSNNQSAVAGTPVAVVPQVKVTDQYGNAVPNVAVTFAVTAGGGAVLPTTPVSTDAQGIARATSWTLGTAIGTNTLRATVVGITAPVIFTATGTAGTPTSIAVGGNGNSQGQTAVANTLVANAPIVIVRDANSNPVSGVNVRFTIGSGNGKILTGSSDNTGQNTIDVTSGADGGASIFAWRLGSTGANTLNVSLPDYSSVSTFVFTATGIIGPATQIAPSNQSWGFTQASTVHGGSPSVLVRDAGGNPVPSVTVNWTTPDANSTLSGAASSTTSAAGIAAFPRGTVNWTAGTSVGQTMTLVATVSGTSVTRSFTSKIVGAPATLTKHAGDNQSGSVSTPLAIKPATRIVDAAGDPVPGTSITFAVTAGGGSVTGTPATADSVGVATVGNWTLGPTVGTSNTLRASLTSTPATFVDFTASAAAGAPASVQARSGNPTSGPANSSISVGVVVRDAAGNLVPNANVTFTITGTPSNAAITGTNPVATNASGEAIATWRLDTLARTNTVTAAVGSISTTLSATSTALTASKLIVSAGNNQTAAPNGVLPVQPQVKVADQYNNAVGGVIVTFAPAAGSGTVNCGTGASASCTSTSSGTGIASTTWTLGSAAGVQTLQASMASPAVSISFTATAGDPCTPTPLSLGAAQNGALATGDCQVGSQYRDYFSLTVPAATTRAFSVTYGSTAYAPQLVSWLWSTGTTGPAWNWFQSSPATMTLQYVLGAGTHTLGATTTAAGTTGSYTFSSTVDPAVNGCGDFLTTKNISVTHTLDTNCNYTKTTQGTGAVASKKYILYVAANERIRVQMTSTAIDSYLECFDVTATYTTPPHITNCFNDDGAGAGNSLMDVPQSTSARYIMIRAANFGSTPSTGTYTLAITNSP